MREHIAGPRVFPYLRNSYHAGRVANIFPF